MIDSGVVEIDGAEIFFKSKGLGPPVLFLHGNPDCADMWGDYLDELGEAYQCFAIDIPGFKRSATPLDFDFSFESMGHFIDSLLIKLQINEKITIVMHDFGGAYGLSFAVQYPEKVKSLVITNTIVNVDYRWHFWGRVWRTKFIGEMSMKLSSKWLFRFELSRGSQKLTKDWMDQRYEQFDYKTQRAVLAMYRAADPWRLTKRQRKLDRLYETVPTLVLWGEKDPYIPLRFSRCFGENVVIYPNSGHWVTLEEKKDVLAKIEDFLKKA